MIYGSDYDDEAVQDLIHRLNFIRDQIDVAKGKPRIQQYAEEAFSAACDIAVIFLNHQMSEVLRSDKGHIGFNTTDIVDMLDAVKEWKEVAAKTRGVNNDWKLHPNWPTLIMLASRRFRPAYRIKLEDMRKNFADQVQLYGLDIPPIGA